MHQLLLAEKFELLLMIINTRDRHAILQSWYNQPLILLLILLLPSFCCGKHSSPDPVLAA